MKKSPSVGLLCAVLVMALSAAPGEARELIYGSWLGANNSTNTKNLEPYFAKVKEATGGEIEWKLVGGGQLANGPGTPDAVKDGLMDAGLVMAPYVPKMLPATNMIFSQSLIGDDFLASIGAMNEVLMLGCEECKEEFHANNAVGFGGYGVTPYLFMCRGEPDSLEDLKGLKVRGSGGGVNIIEIAGGTPVAMPPNEATTALERGALDCVLGGVQWLKSFGYMDVVDTVIQAPMGMGGPPVLMYVNREVWQSLTPEQRKVHVELMPSSVVSEAYDAQLAEDESVVAEAQSKGVKFVDGGEPFHGVMVERDKIQYGLNVENAKAAGVKNPEAILDFYLAAYEKWKKIVDEIGGDRAKFEEALTREVYSKVDPESL
ncbi:MAG: C4-dicarboxylate TRAP transporter substrate-binding protein [Propylenella sp.]